MKTLFNAVMSDLNINQKNDLIEALNRIKDK